MTFRAIDPAVAKIYYAEEADRPITTLNIPDGSLVIFTDSGLEESFDAVSIVWFSRDQITRDNTGKTAGSTVVRSKPERDIIDNNADGFTYYGSAAHGSAEADAAWVVERQSNTSPDEFIVSEPNQIWNNRAALSYNSGVA